MERITESWSWALTAKAHQATGRRHLRAQGAIAAEWDYGTLPAFAQKVHDEHGELAAVAFRAAKVAEGRL